MVEQEKLEKEALALEALEEISGGLSAAGIKNGVKSANESVKKGFNFVKNYAKENPGKTAAIITTLIGAGAFAHGEYKHGGKLIRHTLAGDPVENLRAFLVNNADLPRQAHDPYHNPLLRGNDDDDDNPHDED